MSSKIKSITRVTLLVMCWIAVAVSGCKKQEIVNLPNTFDSLSTDEKMEILMKKLPPDSVALYICDAAMGKKYDSRIELSEAINYAYINYKEADQITFTDALNRYGERLPLNEKNKFNALSNLIEPDMFGYEIGLSYVGTIREEGLDAKKVKEEIDRFKKECESDPETYKRFIKGFKEALKLDRGRDLDEQIYTQFITYPDSI